MLQCSVQHRAAAGRSVLQYVLCIAVDHDVLKCDSARYTMPQCVAVCCRVLQCVAHCAFARAVHVHHST